MRSLAVVLPLAASAAALTWNTFDGPGFPACREAAAVFHPTTVDEIVNIVKDASAAGTPVRASGVGHMWYDTLCADDPRTIIVQTNGTAAITNFTLPAGASEGSVWVEAGTTFFELADYLHERNASMGHSLVNWNITIAGAVAMGAHRSSLSEHSTVAGGMLALDIIAANGTIIRLSEAEHGDTDEWRAALCSLGLLGIIARVQMKVFPEFKLSADQHVLDEDEVLNGNVTDLIFKYPTANFWWWPGLKKFHHRTYSVVPIDTPGVGFQSTFSISEFEASTAKTTFTLGAGAAWINQGFEGLLFAIWSAPNYHTKDTDQTILSWPVVGFSHDSLIGGLYPNTKTEWDYDMHGYTFELAFPMTQANRMFKRVRELLDASAAAGKPMTSTYRSGVNIKFAKRLDSLLGQSTTVGSAPWAKEYESGAIMLDWPTFRPNTDGVRFNEPFYKNLSETLIKEFPAARPHWTKNTREVLTGASKNLDQELVSRFAAVRQSFDPKGTFKSVVGEIIGVS